MCIVGKAWNQMPVQMRHHIAEASQVDFFRLQDFAQRRLNLTYRTHQGRSIFYRQISHFLDVCIPDHAAEAGVIRIGDQDDAQLFIAEKNFSAGLFAQLTGCGHAYTSTRSMPPLLARAT